MRGAEKALISGYKDIGSFCDRMNLTRKISDQAKQYFKIADAAKLTKGKNNMAFIAACIYTACRAGGNTRTLKEICASTGNPRPQPEGSFAIRLSFLKYILGVPRREIGRCHKQLVPLIRDQQQLKTISSVDFIARPCSILGIGPELQKIAIEVIQKASQIGCNAGKSPLTIAAAAIYLISLLFPNYAHVQKDISVVIGVSESTFRNAYREMHLHRHEIIPLVSGITTELIESLP
jgi:transcription initiation factor TFIIB